MKEINYDWLDIMNYLTNKWYCSYFDMKFWYDVGAPYEYQFIKQELIKAFDR